MTTLIRRQTSSKNEENFNFFTVPDTVNKLILYWNDRPGVSKLRITARTDSNSYVDPTKRFKKCVYLLKKLIAGTAFSNTEFVRKNRKFTHDEIKLIMDRFSLAATSDRHYPLRKDLLRKFALEDFIYNTFYKDESLRSQFLYYSEHEPKPRVEIIGEAPAEKFPPLTVALLRRCETVFNFDANDWRTRNNMVIAANNLYKFWVENERTERWLTELTVNSVTAEFIDSLIVWSRRKEDRRVHPQTLTQDWAMDGVFKSHCLSMGLLAPDEIEDLPDESLTLPEVEEDTLETRETYNKPSTSDLQKLSNIDT